MPDRPSRRQLLPDLIVFQITVIVDSSIANGMSYMSHILLPFILSDVFPK